MKLTFGLAMQRPFFDCVKFNPKGGRVTVCFFHLLKVFRYKNKGAATLKFLIFCHIIVNQ